MYKILEFEYARVNVHFTVTFLILITTLSVPLTAPVKP